MLKFEFTAHLKGALVDICSWNRFSHIHFFYILHNMVDCVVGSLDLPSGQNSACWHLNIINLHQFTASAHINMASFLSKTYIDTEQLGILRIRWCVICASSILLHILCKMPDPISKLFPVLSINLQNLVRFMVIKRRKNGQGVRKYT